jgi:hypothetical protein
MTPPSRSARLRTVLSWPLGIAGVSWRYMWRTTALHQSEETGSVTGRPDPADEGSQPGDGRQPATAGFGPLLHRTYAMEIADARLTPEALLARSRPG